MRHFQNKNKQLSSNFYLRSLRDLRFFGAWEAFKNLTQNRHQNQDEKQMETFN